MKNLIFTFLFALVCAGQANAQAPQAFNFQAVARNNAGQAIVNQVIALRVSVLTGSTTGTAEYIEKFTATTNQSGMFTIGIGTGTPLSGTFGGITWGSGNKYLNIEMDIAGGTNYTQVGTQQLLSVPYALYAQNAGNSTANYTAGNGISIAGNTIANTGDLSNTNEIQTLSLAGNELALSNGGGTVTLPMNYWVSNANGISYNNGNVGIGMISPNAKLHLSSNSIIKIDPTINQIKSGLEIGYSYLYDNHDDNGSFPNNSTVTNKLIIGTNPTVSKPIGFFIQNIERATISENGNFGIGTNNIKSKLHVSNGDIYLDDATKGVIMKSPNGQCWRMTVSNTGQPVFTAITCP